MLEHRGDARDLLVARELAAPLSAAARWRACRSRSMTSAGGVPEQLDDLAIARRRRRDDAVIEGERAEHRAVRGKIGVDQQARSPCCPARALNSAQSGSV